MLLLEMAGNGGALSVQDAELVSGRSERGFVRSTLQRLMLWRGR